MSFLGLGGGGSNPLSGFGNLLGGKNNPLTQIT